MAKVYYHKYPEFVQALENRHLVYNKTVRDIERLEAEGKIFVVRPSRELTIGRTESDPGKLQEVYDIGRRDALCRMRDLRLWLEKDDPVCMEK